MSDATDTDELLRIARTLCPAFEGSAPTGQPAPYVVLFGGTGTPEGDQLDGRTPHRDVVHHLIVASNHPRGCRTVANRLAGLIHGAHFETAVFEVRAVSSPMSDPADASTPWWTATIEVHHHTRS